MYLHLGSNISVPAVDVIGIFDLDNCSASRITRSVLRAAEEEGMVIPVGEELPKSLVVCCPRGSWQRLYLSPLSAGALQRRLEEGTDAGNGPESPSQTGKERIWKR